MGGTKRTQVSSIATQVEGDETLARKVTLVQGSANPRSHSTSENAQFVMSCVENEGREIRQELSRDFSRQTRSLVAELMKAMEEAMGKATGQAKREQVASKRALSTDEGVECMDPDLITKGKGKEKQVTTPGLVERKPGSGDKKLRPVDSRPPLRLPALPIPPQHTTPPPLRKRAEPVFTRNQERVVKVRGGRHRAPPGEMEVEMTDLTSLDSSEDCPVRAITPAVPAVVLSAGSISPCREDTAMRGADRSTNGGTKLKTRKESDHAAGGAYDRSA